jgi:hypothetical protein
VQVHTGHITDTPSVLYEFTFSSVQAVTAAEIYWAEISDPTGTESDHWEVGVDDARSVALTKASPSGANGSWAAPTYDLFYRLVCGYRGGGAVRI